MITVSILVNGRPIYTRTAVNTRKDGQNGGRLYKIDDGNKIEHERTAGAIELAKKMLDLIDPAIHTKKQDAKSVADVDAEKAKVQALQDMGETFKDTEGDPDADIKEDVDKAVKKVGKTAQYTLDELKRKIIDVLVDHPHGLSKSHLARKLGLNYNYLMATAKGKQALKELEEKGTISTEKYSRSVLCKINGKSENKPLEVKVGIKKESTEGQAIPHDEMPEPPKKTGFIGRLMGR